MAEKTLLTQSEAAKYLSVSVRYLRMRSDVKVTELPGHGAAHKPLIRYRVKDLDAWVDDLTATASKRKTA